MNSALTSTPSAPSLLERLTEQGVQLLTETVLRNPYIPHVPTVRQAVFLTLPHLEALFGGAAGGGKSDALLMGGLQYVDEPEYAGIIFRRTYRDLALPDAVMDRAHDWLADTPARWNENKKTWSFPSGASLTFAYLAHDNDRFSYQSAAFQYVAWDELTQFAEPSYRYIFSRSRRPQGSRIPIRHRSASNPGGVGHDWVRGRFLDETVPDRTFVPSKLDDNPYLDRDEYIRSLDILDPFTRRQLLAGDWYALPPGSKFHREWFPIVGAVPAEARRVRYWDLAATEPKPGNDPDWTAGVLMAAHDGRYWIMDITRIRTTPQGVEALIKQTAALDGTSVDIWMEQEPGASGVNTIDHYRRRVLDGYSFRGLRSTGAKEVRANPLSSAAEAGNVLLIHGPWIAAFLEEAVSFPNGSHDDQIDAASGALQMLAIPQSFRAEDIDRAFSEYRAVDAELFAS